MKYDEAIAEISKDNTKSMWREAWQADGIEKYVMYFPEIKMATDIFHYRSFKVEPFFAKFIGDTVKFCWTPTLIDASADDWIVTEEY